MVICVYGASSDTIHPDFILAGEALGRAMARRGHSLVFGGGGHGLMGAVARGVKSGGGSITGVAPRFFNVDGVLFDGCTEFVYTDTMRERKAIMEERADAFLMTPGGIGTFEEFFEILTLRQLGRHNKPIGVLNTRDYFAPLHAMFEASIQEGFVKPACRALYTMEGDPEALLDYLESDEAVNLDVRGMKNIL